MLQVLPSFPLKTFNTFGFDVKATAFCHLHSEKELQEIDHANSNRLPVFILGGGSNMLLTEDMNRFVVHNQLKGITPVKEDTDHIWLKVKGGEIWHHFVMYCVARNYGGIENLALIPGTVGAAPIQNIGAYGAEAAETIEQVTFWNLETHQFHTLAAKDCHFGYRESIFKHDLKGKIAVTEVLFRLSKAPALFKTGYGAIQQELAHLEQAPSVASIARAVINIRTAKLPDPAVIGNSGSFFKNPELPEAAFDALKARYPDIPSHPAGNGLIKVPAAWMIERCGWKGYRNGPYGVHEHQALVLVNYGGATGKEIFHLSENIIRSVKEQFGLELEREVQVY